MTRFILSSQVPIQVTGIALGMTLLLNLVGMSLGPALSGIFQELYKEIVPGIPGFFPTDQAYSMIFTTAALVSLASLAMSVSVSRTRIER